jgi:hypothetical protein
MTTLNNGSSHAQRKTLATQLDRLDVILDGLSDALSGSVETAVRDVVGQVVRETVEATIREVLSNQDLLRAALGQPITPEPQPVPAPVPRRRTLKDLLQSAGNYAREKAGQVADGVKQAFAWGLTRLRRGCSALAGGCLGALGACAKAPSALAAVGCTLWTFRKTTSVALTVGVLAGVGSYFAGPVISSIASGISGAALTVSAMVLVPLWRLLSGNGGA